VSLRVPRVTHLVARKKKLELERGERIGHKTTQNTS